MKKYKHIENLYFCFREVNNTLEYSIILNADSKTKDEIYKKEKEGFEVRKVVLNEGGIN